MKKEKNESVKRKFKKGALLTGVAIGVGATFVVSSVASLVEKGMAKHTERKEKRNKNKDK